MRVHPNGESWVSFDDGPEFQLSRQLTSLLRLLAEVHYEPKPDRSVTTQEMLQMLKARFGGTMDAIKLAAYFLRLRIRLDEAGTSPFYIERQRRVGARLVLAKHVLPQIIDIGTHDPTDLAFDTGLDSVI
jgi:hypothetical protein